MSYSVAGPTNVFKTGLVLHGNNAAHASKLLTARGSLLKSSKLQIEGSRNGLQPNSELQIEGWHLAHLV